MERYDKNKRKGVRWTRRTMRAQWAAVVAQMGLRGRIEIDPATDRYQIKGTGSKCHALTVRAMLEAGVLVPVPREEWDLCRYDSPELEEKQDG